MARVFKWIGIALGVILALVAALVFGIDTGPGHDLIRGQIAAYRTQSGLNFRVGRIEGSIYGKMTLIDFEARDQNGVYLTAPRASVDWRPFAYVNNRLDIRALIVPTARLARLPVLKPVPRDPNEPILPDLHIDIDRFELGRLEVAPAVTGRRHIVGLAGMADVANGHARVTLDGEALRAPGVAGGDRLRAKLDAVPDANRLVIDADLRAPAGGLVDSYARLGKPMAFSIKGQGDWRAWNGRARGQVGGAPLADLALSARSGTFRATGMTMPGTVAPVAARMLPRVAVDLVAAVADRRADLRFTARADALTLGANGLIDLGESRFRRLIVDLSLLQPQTITPKLAGDDVLLHAVLDGPIARPLLDYRITARRIAFGTTGVEALSASGQARVDADRILIPVHATARRVTGLNAAAGGLLENLRIDGDLAYTGGRLLSDNLKLRSSRIDATALVLADPAKGVYTGALKGRVNDYQVAGLGRIALTTDANLVADNRGGYGIRGTFRVVTREITNQAIATQLGGQAVTTARFLFDQSGTARLALLRLDAPDFRVTSGEGSYAIDTGRLTFRAAGASDNYGPFTLAANGTLERPRVLLTAARPGLGIGLADLVAEVNGTPAGYALNARGESQYGPFTADVLVRRGARLAVDIRRATVAGITAQGSVAQTAAGPFAGQLAFTGAGLSGTAALSAQGQYQRADVQATAQAGRIPGEPPITIGSGQLRATAVLFPKAPQVTGAFAFKDIRRGTYLINNARGRIDYRDQAGRVQLIADGDAGVPFNLAAQARLAPDRVLANLSGRVNTIPVSLDHPALVLKQGADWVLQPVTLVVPQGRVALGGRYGAATSLQARFDNFDVAIAQAFVPGLGLGGRASGTVDYAQARGQAVPDVRARLDLARFTRTAAYVVSEPVDVALLATLGRGGGGLNALVKRGGTTVGRIQARLGALGGGATLNDRLLGAPLSGGVRYSGPADVLWTLTGIAGQDVRGGIAVAADFAGTPRDPQLNGVLRANALRYENQTYGTVINNIALQGRFTRSRLEILSMTGRAGAGSITGQGSIGLGQGFPIDLRTSFTNAQLARSDALGATVSGTLAISNSAANGARISGELRLPEARYEVIRQGQAEIVELTGVRRKNQPPSGDARAAEATPASNWQLDIAVRADNQLYVSGMGLEAEFSSDLRVTGTASAPRVVGELRVVRGTYSFAGRRFTLADTGVIRFAGGRELNPALSIAASTTVEGVSATVNIGGTAQNPQITFTSTPALPQDEVLSRLLFGGPVTSLSPIQAIQLAAALNSLRGSGGGLNPLGKLRSATGLSRLRILGADKATGRGTALAAGQYISRNIYVEIITDARGFTATQIEISLSRALSLLSSTGSFGGSNASLRYSKDY
ncbi:MAG: translocation/assembly module TamB domain-containing protein [Sphingomonas sp.]|nr:translocation/assembly module TamB domain-containing protein [Sphingomonas sp.]